METMKKRVTLLLSSAVLAGCVLHSGRPAAVGSAEPRSTDFTRQTVTISPTGWPQRLEADLYIPDGPGPFPGVIAVHGGGWDARDRSDMDRVSRKLARRGYVVANVDYRLAPQFLSPAQLQDVRVAIRWLRSNATKIKVDPRRIGGWGYSAGAHLVALAATEGSEPDARLQAVVAGGTPSNLLAYPQSPIITRFIGGTYREQPKAWVDASPLSHVTPDDPPMFLYHGTWDRLVYAEDSVAFKVALDRAGVPAELYQVRGFGHIVTFLLGGGAEGAGIGFLDRHLRR